MNGDGPIVTDFAPAQIEAITLGADDVFVGTYSLVGSFGKIDRIGIGSSAPLTIASDVGLVTGMAADASYAYFTATDAYARSALHRVAYDGTKASIVVDEGNVYWAYAPYGALSDTPHPGAIRTTCK